MSSQFGLPAAWFGSADEESDALSVQEHLEEPSNHHRWTYQAAGRANTLSSACPLPPKSRLSSSAEPNQAADSSPGQPEILFFTLFFLNQPRLIEQGSTSTSNCCGLETLASCVECTAIIHLTRRFYLMIIIMCLFYSPLYL